MKYSWFDGPQIVSNGHAITTLMDLLNIRKVEMQLFLFSGMIQVVTHQMKVYLSVKSCLVLLGTSHSCGKHNSRLVSDISFWRFYSLKFFLLLVGSSPSFAAWLTFEKNRVGV